MWSSPRTFVDGEIERARYFNQSIRDNLREFAGYYAEVLTSESTTATGYGNLTTFGPQITAIVGGTQVLIAYGAQISPTAAARCEGEMSVTTSQGGTLVFGPSDNYSAAVDNTAQNRGITQGWMMVLPDSAWTATFTAGTAYTFTNVYRAINANGATFQYRWMYVQPVGP